LEHTWPDSTHRDNITPNSAIATDEFFREYTSGDAILKYTRATAGFGISYLLDHDYKDVYLQALDKLPDEVKRRGIRILEFGCGGGMNLLHFVRFLGAIGVHVETAIGVDFSPVLIEAANREANEYPCEGAMTKPEFHLANNERLTDDLAVALKAETNELEGSFHFIFGVNTIRYCHDAGKELENAQNIFKLLVPGGVCVVIDMNNRFPLFRSDLKNRFRRKKEEECYVPSLEGYAAPFAKTGFQILRKENFCWVPHSSGRIMCRLTSAISPLLNLTVRSRAMRSLVVSRKPR
jgi:SAM-dependent methyltransferase